MSCDTGYAVSRDGSTCEGIPSPETEEQALEAMRERKRRDIAIAGLLVGQEDFFSLRILFQLFSFLFSRNHGRL